MRLRILSRYVLKQFATPLGLSVVAFAVVFIVINLVDRLSAFIDAGTGLVTIFVYYVYYLPEIVVLILPMAVLLAGLLCKTGPGYHRALEPAEIPLPDAHNFTMGSIFPVGQERLCWQQPMVSLTRLNTIGVLETMSPLITDMVFAQYLVTCAKNHT